MSWQEPTQSQEKTWKFSLKKWDKQQWMILLLLGLLLLVMALPTKKISQTSSKGTAEGGVKTEETAAGDELYGNTYGSMAGSSGILTEKAVLERQLEDLLQQVEGIGKVKVMLMPKGTEEEMAAFSSQNPSISIEGVLVAAQGGDNSVVVRNIQEAVMALFQVEAHKIKVMKMK